MVKQCPSCNQSFSTKNRKQRCCSHRCDLRTRAIRDKVTAQCVHCGQSFERWPYDIQRKACSPTCRREARRCPRPAQHRRAMRPCDQCGIDFWPRTDQHRFCGQACYWQHLTTIRGAAHPAWRGVPADPRPDLSRAAWHRLRAALIAAAHGKCSVCDQAKPRLIVHHVERAQDAPTRVLDTANLQVVCQACHNRIHNPVLSRWAHHKNHKLASP